MFSPAFIMELFKPQVMYTTLSTKQIFEKLAHSSIMRLNKTSMDKLYDLMTMGFKYQLLQSISPQQYLHTLLNHLDSIKEMIGNDPVSDLVQVAIDLAINTYVPFSTSQWFQLKTSLMKFIQGKRIKVSLFIQHKMQTMDGTLNLDLKGKLPVHTEIPGLIRYYEGASLVSSRTFPTEFQDPSIIEAKMWIDPESCVGINMYSKTFRPESKVRDPLVSSIRALSLFESNLTNNKPEPVGLADKKFVTSVADSKSMAKAELNMLANLLGVSDSKGEKADVNFKLNLFPESLVFDAKESSEDAEDSNFIMIDIDGTADAKSLKKYMEALDLHEKSGNDMKLDDDLLSLMDSAK